ncbi:aminoglycoside phosphotransferase family protein [Nocardioides sp.]|uniref:aminoglycoside phosphotransferase family protein n=1 Tax=Nocardioides sp. TaxID=35761 RepID=UPI002724918A|nr:aminoglycoside phosphotransferase family protein [Nocardioides sp.]MDO9458089.1 aminoglycoside phosphotransferase family protein [Nocardioides sp.]
MRLPDGWLDPHRHSEGWLAWAAALPRLAATLLDEWDLVEDGEQRHGNAAVVLMVRTADGTSAALKVGWPHEEAQHEHLALQHWHGQGAVRLLRADPGRSALLLERLHPTDLSDAWDLQACEVVAGLYQHLHVPAVPQLRRLSSYVGRATERLAELPRSAPVPRRLVEQAVALGRAFATDDATDGTMIHGDLHYENVLAADREPWLAIDPKPMSGDPHHEVAPLLWNRWAELAGDVRDGVRRRFHTVVDTAGLDEDRARDWVVVRMLHQALDELEETEPDGDWITRCVTVAKAVQD